MSDDRYMVQWRLNAERLIQFVQEQGVNRVWDEDLGYCVHAWLTATFGPLAPKPFRLLDPGVGWRKNRPLQLLAYSAHAGAELCEQAQTFATPLALVVSEAGEWVCVKPMPASWAKGRRLGFEVLACPVSRREDTEKDVFLRRVEAACETDPPLDRAAVYREWLTRQLDGVAVLESAQLAGFRLVRLMRKSQLAGEQTRRYGRRLVHPQALLRGELTVRDGAAFATRLARGVGRHRAFGYGMLLLRPPA